MKRRSFLGLFGGAVVAGPAAAKTAVESLTPVSGIPKLIHGLAEAGVYINGEPLYHPWASDADSALSASFVDDRISALQKLLAGEPVDESDRQADKNIAIEMNVHALASVSAGAKVSMLKRRAKQAHIDDRKPAWLQELQDLLAKK